MRIAKNFLVIVVAALMFCGMAQGQALKLVPANALMVLRVANLEETSKKLGELAGSLGLAQARPEFADPLAELQKDSGMAAGLNKAGDAVIVYVDPDSVGGDDDMAMLALVPVSDYKAFISNWPDAMTTADITEVHFKDNPQASYIVNWGDYAAISPSKDIVSKKPEQFLTMGTATGKAMDGKDFALFVNLKGWRAKILPQIDQGRTQFNSAMDMAINSGMKVPNIDMAKMGPLVKMAASQMMDLAKKFINQADGAVVTGNVTSDGISLMDMVEFAPDSPMGKDVAQIQNTNDSLLNGLPDGKYIIFGGSKGDPKLTSQIFSDFIDPITKDFASLGDVAKPLNDFVDAAKEMVGAETQGEFGLMAPTGQLGVDPLVQLISIKQGDAKTIADAEKKVIALQKDMMKAVGMDGTNFPTSTETADAKTVDGVAFDEVKTGYDNNGATPQQMQMQMMMAYLYGPNGAVFYRGAVNDNTLLNYSGLSDATVSATIAAIKGNDAPLSKLESVKAVAAKLPSQRAMVVYVPLDVLASTALNYAKEFGIDPGVKMPENLQPIGVTVGTEGTAIRVDTYIPTSLVQALTAAGMQVWMSHNGGGGGPNGL